MTDYGSVEGVAVIGMAGRWPGAADVETFWRHLCAGTESVSFFSDEELAAAGVRRAELEDPSYVKARAVLADVDLFAAAFFEFSPREAEFLDPQQRLFLECAWQAFEDAACDPARYQGAIGVYAGISASSYLHRNLAAHTRGPDAGQAMVGNDRDFFATRVSYKLGLTGPSMTVQTACSTSLVAAHMACQGLLAWQCDVALAGGVTVKLPQESGHLYQQGGIFSSDGHCRPFDAAATGTVGGSGAGAVILKRLEDALADGDRIYAVIRGSAANNDGAAKVGYTAPSVDGQAEAIATAQALAGIDADTVDYVETHGTGTPLGDPVEIAALTKAFRASTDRRGFCAIGSVKSNLGHLDAAAGVTGLIKTVLALHHRRIPPSLHFDSPNAQIDFAQSPFYVAKELAEWPAGETPHRAGVSSFGAGGTNAHMVLEEAPNVTPSGPSKRWQLLPLSARTGAALETAATDLADFWAHRPELDPADVAFTLQVGRRALEHRRTVVVRDREDAIEALAGREPKRVRNSTRPPSERPVVFLLPGGGAQYPNMGRELYRSEPVFRAGVDRCAELFEPHVGLDLRTALYPGDGAAQDAARNLRKPRAGLAALFAVEYALTQLWRTWGVEPWAMIGHSMGEYVAACLSGVLSLEDAVFLVAVRARLFERLSSGAMLSLPLPEAEARVHLGQELSVAAVNGPAHSVLSGPREAVEALRLSLLEQGLEARSVAIEVAAHSRQIDPILEEFAAEVRKLSFGEPRIPYASNVTGTWITPEDASDPEYWVRHLRHTVRFGAGLDAVLAEDERILLEVGPGRTLVTLARQHPRGGDAAALLTSLPHPNDPQPADAWALSTLGRLWLSGRSVDWSAYHDGERRSRVTLPTYPFERQRYWIEAGTGPELPLEVGEKTVADCFYLPIWKQAPVPSEAAEEADSWLLFIDSEGLGMKLAGRLAGTGARVMTVVPGARFEARGETCFELDPGSPSDYAKLADELSRRGETEPRIGHLWLACQRQAGSSIDGLDTVLERGFFSLLHLAQALAQREGGQIDLTVVSQGLYKVTGSEILEPEQMTVLGPCQVMPQELPRLRCRTIDMASAAPDEADFELLLRELTTPATTPAVALRGGLRWLPDFDHLPVGAPAETPQLRPDGVFLITGGLGGIGLELAAFLARTANARLVLVGRRGLPPREEWAHRSTSDPRLSETIRRVQALEEIGAEVLVVAADCTDREQMAAVVAAALDRFGAIHGVIHAAGVSGGGLIELKTPEAAAQVLAPKVRGTLVLDEALAGIELDVFVLCSSLSSILGGLGQVDYSAANAFLNAFAARRHSAGTPTVSIVWDSWHGVGMAVEKAETGLDDLREEHMSGGISPRTGAEAFRRSLSLGVPTVVISSRNLAHEIERSRQAAALHNLSAAATPIGPNHPRPDLETAYTAPQTGTEETLVEIWQEVLGIEPIGIHDEFAELGGHSLLATQVVSRVRRAFQVDLPLRALFEKPTIADLALALVELRAGQTDARSVEELLARLEELPEAEVDRLLSENAALLEVESSHE